MAERAPRCKLLPVRICLPVPMGERESASPPAHSVMELKH
jgi:hypothetical protein